MDRHAQKLSRLKDDRISRSKPARRVRHLELYRWRTIYEADVRVPGARENGPPPNPGVACRPGVKRAGDPLGNPAIMMRRLIGCDALRLQGARITQVDRWGGQSGLTEADEGEWMSVASEHAGPERAIPKALQVFGDRVHGRFAGIQHEWGIIQVEPSSGLTCWHVKR